MTFCYNNAMRGHVFDILKSNLTQGSHFFQIAEFVSHIARIDIGVLRDSEIGPRSSIIYVNDMSNIPYFDKFNTIENNHTFYRQYIRFSRG